MWFVGLVYSSCGLNQKRGVSLILLGVVQYVAGFLLLTSLNAKGYNVLAISVPSWKEFTRMVNLAGPVLLTTSSKVMARLCLHLVLLSFVLFLSSEI